MGLVKNTYIVEFLLQHLKVKKGTSGYMWGLIKCILSKSCCKCGPDFYAFEQCQVLCFCANCEKSFEFINGQEISRIVKLSASRRKNSAPLSKSPCYPMKLTS